MHRMNQNLIDLTNIFWLIRIYVIFLNSVRGGTSLKGGGSLLKYCMDFLYIGSFYSYLQYQASLKISAWSDKWFSSYPARARARNI